MAPWKPLNCIFVVDGHNGWTSVRHRMLKKGIPVTEVSFATGYLDISHFIKVFKKETDMTPRKFRQEYVKG